MTFRPEDAMGYWLFYAHRCVAYAFSEVLRQACLDEKKPYTVTPPQFGVLALLYEGDGVTIGVISQKRGVDAPTITGIVQRLEQSGLVERRHDRRDRRVVKVYLTAEGQGSKGFLTDAAERFNALMTRGFSETQEQELRTKLQQIIVNLSAAAPGAGDRFGLLPDDFHCDQ